MSCQAGGHNVQNVGVSQGDVGSRAEMLASSGVALVLQSVQSAVCVGFGPSTLVLSLVDLNFEEGPRVCDVMKDFDSSSCPSISIPSLLESTRRIAPCVHFTCNPKPLSSIICNDWLDAMMINGPRQVFFSPTDERRCLAPVLTSSYNQSLLSLGSLLSTTGSTS